MTIRDEVIRAAQLERTKELSPPVIITPEMRKEITNILISSKRDRSLWWIVVPLTEENTTNPFFSVKQVRPASWWRKAKYKGTYRKGSLKRLIRLLNKEGVGAYVTELGENGACLSIELNKADYPYVYAKDKRLEDIENRL